jgi:hypothetical protein
LEGKNEEKAGMSVGLRERERERERKSFCDERASEAEEKEPRLVRIKFQQPFPFSRLLLKERARSLHFFLYY